MENEKTNGEKKSIFRKILPIIFGIFAILEYLYFPNHKKKYESNSCLFIFFNIFTRSLFDIFYSII